MVTHKRAGMSGIEMMASCQSVPRGIDTCVRGVSKMIDYMFI